jgi:hypothetical protein
VTKSFIAVNTASRGILPIGGPNMMYCPSFPLALIRKMSESSSSMKKTDRDFCQMKRFVKVYSEISGGFSARYLFTRGR